MVNINQWMNVYIAHCIHDLGIEHMSIEKIIQKATIREQSACQFFYIDFQS